MHPSVNIMIVYKYRKFDVMETTISYQRLNLTKVAILTHPGHHEASTAVFREKSFYFYKSDIFYFLFIINKCLLTNLF